MVLKSILIFIASSVSDLSYAQQGFDKEIALKPGAAFMTIALTETRKLRTLLIGCKASVDDNSTINYYGDLVKGNSVVTAIISPNKNNVNGEAFALVEAIDIESSEFPKPIINLKVSCDFSSL